jgi:uncharacterized membrane protein
MFNLKTEKGYIIAIAIALIVVSCVTAVYFISRPGTSGYSEMYLLDAQNGADNYPQVLVVNQNSTFSQQIFVVNHFAGVVEYQLQIKIVQDTISFPVDATANNIIQFSLDPEEQWSSQVPISINTLGTYSVVFELYSLKDGAYTFTNNYCVLHLTVKDSA